MTEHLLIAGGQRCGTTTLARALDAHPDVSFPHPLRPEPKVLLTGRDDLSDTESYERALFGDRVPNTRWLGEKSTSCLETSGVAERAGRIIPGLHVLVVVRDPVERAVSNYRFSVANGMEHRPVAQALDPNTDAPNTWDRDRVSVNPFDYLRRGCYAELLEPWTRTFGPDRLRVLVFEELISGPEVMSDLLRWLHLPSGGGDPATARSNASTPFAIEGLEATREVLRDYFSPSILELERLLGRRLPWSHPAG